MASCYHGRYQHSSMAPLRPMQGHSCGRLSRPTYRQRHGRRRRRLLAGSDQHLLAFWLLHRRHLAQCKESKLGPSPGLRLSYLTYLLRPLTVTVTVPGLPPNLLIYSLLPVLACTPPPPPLHTSAHLHRHLQSRRPSTTQHPIHSSSLLTNIFRLSLPTPHTASSASDLGSLPPQPETQQVRAASLESTVFSRKALHPPTWYPPVAPPSPPPPASQTSTSPSSSRLSATTVSLSPYGNTDTS